MAEADFVPVSSTLELERATGPYGGFHFFRGDAAVTGLPHHDVLESARTTPTNIVFAPSLHGEAGPHATSAQAWNELLHHDTLRSFAAQHEGALQLLLPRDAQHLTALIQAPAWIQQIDTAVTRATILGAAQVLVTDYSRLAHDAAYLRRPTVYFQPDQGLVLGAADSELSAAAAYRDTGFGPVTTSVEQALQQIEHLTQEVPEKYFARADHAFLHRDGQARERFVRHLTDTKNW